MQEASALLLHQNGAGQQGAASHPLPIPAEAPGPPHAPSAPPAPLCPTCLQGHGRVLPSGQRLDAEVVPGAGLQALQGAAVGAVAAAGGQAGGGEPVLGAPAQAEVAGGAAGSPAQPGALPGHPPLRQVGAAPRRLPQRGLRGEGKRNAVRRGRCAKPPRRALPPSTPLNPASPRSGPAPRTGRAPLHGSASPPAFSRSPRGGGEKPSAPGGDPGAPPPPAACAAGRPGRPPRSLPARLRRGAAAGAGGCAGAARRPAGGG